MPGLERKVPPVAVVLIMGLLMGFTSWTATQFHFSFPLQEWIAAMFAVAGTLISLAGVLSFRRAGTTVNPLTPASSSSLVRSGVYRFSRNPMYLGFLLMLLAWGIYLANPLALVFAPLFVLYMNRFQIAPEERALESRFGQDFVDYAGQVRRWL